MVNVIAKSYIIFYFLFYLHLNVNFCFLFKGSC